MINKFDFECSIDKNTQILRITNIPDSDVLSVPNDLDNRKYLSYTLHRADLNKAIKFLELALSNDDKMVRISLFESALIHYIKCYTSSVGNRTQLNETRVYKNVEGEAIKCHRIMKRIRDGYIAHDEEDIKAIKLGLVVNKEKKIRGMLAPEMQADFDYVDNIRILRRLCKESLHFVNIVWEKEHERLYAKYVSKDVEEIRTYPLMKIEGITSMES